MAFQIVDSLIGSQAITALSSTKNHPLGTIVNANDPDYGAGEFIYLSGVANCVRGSVATYAEDDFSTTLLVANAVGPCAVAMGSCTAGLYGWWQISGKAVVKAGTVLDNGNVYATSTAGQVDDAVVLGDMIFRAKFASANGTPSSGLAECEIQRPYTQNGALLDSTEVTATSAELNYLDITTLGTGAASKAVVLDASSNWTSPAAGTVTFSTGAALTCATGSTFTAAGNFLIGATTLVATGAEINRACDVSNRIVTVTGATLAVTEADHDGKTLVLNKADGSTLTLPAATGSGARFRVIVGTAITSGSYVVQVTGNDTMSGFVCTADDTGTPVPGIWVAGASDDTVTLNGGTQGGVIGDELQFQDIAADKWLVRGFLKQSGSEATPFSAAVA